MYEVDKRLAKLSVDEWKADLCRVDAKRGPGRNKLRTYATFKPEFGTEAYLRKPLPYKVRKCFSNLRCGTAPLRIETGRYENPRIDASERYCNVCRTNTVEDEIHFLLICPVYNLERQKLFSIITSIYSDFNLMSTDEKFVFLMSDDNICRFTAKTCHKMFEIRSNILTTNQ